MKWIDEALNRITMYRLVLYFLIFLVVLAFGLSIFRLLPYNPLELALSAIFSVFFSLIINQFWSKIYDAPSNAESTIITGLILSLIVNPASSLADLVFLTEVSLLAISAKYLLAIKKKHVFNPAALAVFLIAYLVGQTPTWWVGNTWMNIPVAVGGLLIVRKIKREGLLIAFLVTVFLTLALVNTYKGVSLLPTYNWLVFQSSIWFFSLIMLTEPQTSPTTTRLQVAYGALVGLLSVPGVHLGSFYFSYESALIAGNIFAYIVSSKEKLILKLKQKIRIGTDIYDFVFPLKQRLSFLPGQYMEWTLPHTHADSRGNRRYLTIASSPTEEEIRLGVKFHTPSSSFKGALLMVDENVPVVGSQLAGEFTLPQDKSKKLVFVAGGIGITPFRSMLKYLIDTKQKRDIVVFYSNKDEEEIVYKDILEEAKRIVGIEVIYSLTNIANISDSWKGVRGRIDEELIKKTVPDFIERKFYLSGPRSMVLAFEKTLSTLGVKRSQIKIDYFPGYA